MTFEWWGREFPMADFAYNTTALNERAVELPIACWWLRNAAGRVLEVGNVLSHYYDSLPKRTVVDRYEGGDGVENIDVFEVTGEWNHIVSISTVEHVRWDEHPREPGGGQAAVEHLQSVLSPKGRMLLTVPLGWNQPLDDWLLDGDTGVDRACTLVRQNDRWVQTERPLWRPYGATQPWAESVWVGEWGTV
jgi:hypothetical protein